MAIYQFYLAVVPREGLMKAYDSLPGKLEPTTETGYFVSGTKPVWRVAGISAGEIVPSIDAIIQRENWTSSGTNFAWKTSGKDIDHDVWISTEEDKIIEFSFRIDLRDDSFDFLSNMLSLVESNDWMVMDRDGTLADPNFTSVKYLIKESRNFKFMKNPEAFLRNLDER